MKLTELFKENKPRLSFEVFPPKTDARMENVMSAVEEIAALTLFIASDSCNMLTGEAIVADMGATLGGNV